MNKTPTQPGWHTAVMKGTSGLLCVRAYDEDVFFAVYDLHRFSLDDFEWGESVDAMFERVSQLEVENARLTTALAKAERARDALHQAFETERVRCNILREERQADAYVYTGAPEDNLDEFSNAQVLLISVGCVRDLLAAPDDPTLGELNGLVTKAILDAEMLPADSVEAVEAYRRISLYEEKIARQTTPTGAEGMAARIGAVTAALRAGEELRAVALASTYGMLDIDVIPKHMHQLVGQAMIAAERNAQIPPEQWARDMATSLVVHASVEDDTQMQENPSWSPHPDYNGSMATVLLGWDAYYYKTRPSGQWVGNIVRALYPGITLRATSESNIQMLLIGVIRVLASFDAQPGVGAR